MITKLIKIFTYIKSNGTAVIGLIATVTLIIGIIQTNRANRWERDHLRLEGKLEEQVKDQDKLYGEAERSRAIRRLEKAEEKKLRETLETRIQEAEEASRKAKIALEQEKKRTAALPPTELVVQINERIGNESSLTVGGLFLFTRIGANRTLDRFKDGEFYLSEYTKQEETISLYEEDMASFNKSMENCIEAEANNFRGWEGCRETLADCLDDREILKKIANANVWKGRIQGGVGGSIITIVACKIFGVF